MMINLMMKKFTKSLLMIVAEKEVVEVKLKDFHPEKP